MAYVRVSNIKHTDQMYVFNKQQQHSFASNPDLSNSAINDVFVCAAVSLPNIYYLKNAFKYKNY